MVQLRDYQVDVLARASSRFAEGNRRVLIQGATGCGKQTITAEAIRRAVARGKRVQFWAHRRLLVEQKSNRLNQFGVEHGVIMNGVQASAAPVQVCSRDTLLSRMIRNDWLRLTPPDLIIIDEAHHYGDENEYARLLGMYPSAHVLGVTATPLPRLANYFQAMECVVGVSRLVKDGYLVGVDCYAPESQVKKKSTKRVLSGDPVHWWKRYARNMPTVLFASRKKESIALAAAFCASGIHAEHMDDNTPDEKREAIVNRAKAGETKVICNCGILTEGWDLPDLGCCQIVRMAGSYVSFAQMVGRVMRPAPGKERAVLIDHSGAVLEHGFPDEDVEWKLQADDDIDARIKKAKKAGERRKPIVCSACGYIYDGAVICPQCGHRLPPPKGKTPSISQQMLIEVPREERIRMEAIDQEKFWRRCVAMAANTGRPMSAAAGMFKQKFRKWPPNEYPYVVRGCQWHQQAALLFPQFVRGK